MLKTVEMSAPVHLTHSCSLKHSPNNQTTTGGNCISHISTTYETKYSTNKTPSCKKVAKNLKGLSAVDGMLFIRLQTKNNALQPTCLLISKILIPSTAGGHRHQSNV